MVVRCRLVSVFIITALTEYRKRRMLPFTAFLDLNAGLAGSPEAVWDEIRVC
jgi:hypothetical protein